MVRNLPQIIPGLSSFSEPEISPGLKKGSINADLVREAERYVMSLLKNNLSMEYLFHSKEHTLNVTKSATIIGQCSGINEDEMNILMICALFNDTGYIRSYDDHESESSFIAGEFLRFKQVEEPTIKLVGDTIKATKIPQQPIDKISEILCDADLMHLASEDYFEQMELLRLEWQVTGQYYFTENQFHLNSIEFFNNHHFHTDYGKTFLQEKKNRNLIRIKQKILAHPG
jgi:uncharacterized protein